MKAVKTFTDLEFWKKSRLLTKVGYSISKLFPHDELHGVTSQVRRSVVSVDSNIAEGSGRQISKDTIQFLPIAHRSLNGLGTQLNIAFDLVYISEQ